MSAARGARAVAGQRSVAEAGRRPPRPARRALPGWSAAPSSAGPPFRIEVPEAELDDLRARLRAARWPEPEPVDDWSQGVPLAYLRELCAWWAEEYDWRATEARLNAIPQFTTEIDGLAIHFLHVRSPHPARSRSSSPTAGRAPCSSSRRCSAPLTEPEDPADAFHVVVPSLPGYGFSGKPAATGWGVERIARRMGGADGAARLRALRRRGKRLGHHGEHARSACSDREHVAGIHLVPPLAPPDPATLDRPHRSGAARRSTTSSATAEWESGYSREHATRPQTIGYALVDSPVALAAWIGEKFLAWTDNDGHPEDAVARRAIARHADALLAPARRRLLRAAVLGEHPAGGRVDLGRRPASPSTVPTGCTVFPARDPAPLAPLGGPPLRRHPPSGEPPRGGHFPGLEQPELLAAELRAFFRLVR